MGEYRMQKLAEQIRGEISSLLLAQKIKDPRVSTFASINRVELSRDLSWAKVHVSSFLDDKKLRHCVDGLNSAAGFIQSSIAKKLTIRQFPKLTFLVDTSIKDEMEMSKKIDEIIAQDAAAHG